MKQRGRLIIPVISLLILCSSCVSSRANEARVVGDTLEAIDACYHWGGEVGDQSEERNKVILEGLIADCPRAQEKAESALKTYPQNEELAAGILQLIDVGRFEVTPVRRAHICTTAARKFTRDFAKSGSEDVLFRAECEEEAARIYGR